MATDTMARGLSNSIKKGLSSVATSGSYDDLKNIPSSGIVNITIPANELYSEPIRITKSSGEPISNGIFQLVDCIGNTSDNITDLVNNTITQIEDMAIPKIHYIRKGDMNGVYIFLSIDTSPSEDKTYMVQWQEIFPTTAYLVSALNLDNINDEENNKQEE